MFKFSKILLQNIFVKSAQKWKVAALDWGIYEFIRPRWNWMELTNLIYSWSLFKNRSLNLKRLKIFKYNSHEDMT